jgi:L-ascorbate metabolism protein UlaG (beta-lactamase superfamily)
MEKEKELTRREFIKMASASGIGLSALAMLGSACGSQTSATPAEQVQAEPTAAAEATNPPTAAPTAVAEVQPEPTVAAPTPRQVLSTGTVMVEWLGHGSFKFVSPEGLVVLLDPWLETNPVCPEAYRALDGFSKVDLVLYTHGHVDHFMLPDTQAIVERFNPKIIAPWELEFFIKAEIPMADTLTFNLANKGATSIIEGLGITMVGADHSSGAQLTGFEGVNKYVGEPCGYIIQFENGFKIYHSGDTGLMADMELIVGNFYQPDMAILPIGGVFTMGPREAAYACQLIRPQYVIPEHFGTFPVLVQTTEDFVQWTSQYAPETEVVELTPGASVEMPPSG